MVDLSSFARVWPKPEANDIWMPTRSIGEIDDAQRAEALDDDENESNLDGHAVPAQFRGTHKCGGRMTGRVHRAAWLSVSAHGSWQVARTE